MKNKSSTGFEEIPKLLVKRCLCYFIKQLVHIYNVSFQTSFFPDMMRKAKIKPPFKEGDRQNIQNYRPISILSVFPKPLVKINA